MSTGSSTFGQKYLGPVAGIAGIAACWWGAIEGRLQSFFTSCTLIGSIIFGIPYTVYQVFPAVFMKMVCRTIYFFTSYISSTWTAVILSLLSFGTFLSHILDAHWENLSICVDSSQLIILFTKNDGKSSCEAIFKQLLTSGALLKLMKAMKHFLIDLTGVTEASDISPMAQALAHLSSRSLPNQEEDRKLLRDISLQLIRQFFPTSSNHPPLEISFQSAGILGHAAAALSYLVSSLIQMNTWVLNSSNNNNNDAMIYVAGLLEGLGRDGFWGGVKQFFVELSHHRNSDAASQICRLLCCLLQAQLLLKSQSLAPPIQPDLSDPTSSPLVEVLANIEKLNGVLVLPISMKEDVAKIRNVLGLPATSSSSSTLPQVENRVRGGPKNLQLIASVLINVVCVLFIVCSSLSMQACGSGDRDIMTSLLPLRPFLSENGSVVAWSCMGENTDYSTWKTDRDSLIEKVQNLTAQIVSLQMAYRESNSMYKIQIQSVEEKRDAFARQLRALQEIEKDLRNRIDSLESKSINLQNELQRRDEEKEYLIENKKVCVMESEKQNLVTKIQNEMSIQIEKTYSTRQVMSAAPARQQYVDVVVEAPSYSPSSPSVPKDYVLVSLYARRFCWYLSLLATVVLLSMWYNSLADWKKLFVAFFIIHYWWFGLTLIITLTLFGSFILFWLLVRMIAAVLA